MRQPPRLRAATSSAAGSGVRRLLRGVAAGVQAGLDRIAASDPGLLRLLLATRGTLAVFLAGVAAVVAGRATGAPVTAFAAGITFSMMAPFFMNEPSPAQRARTLVILLLPACAATGLTALLHGYGPLGDAGFLLLVFLCFLGNALHPRMIGVGLVAIVMTYVGLFLDLPPALLPAQLASLVAAVPIVAFACFVALPMNPARGLRRAAASVQWRAARVLRHADAAGDDAARLIWRDLTRLNEAALAADDQLALIRPDDRDAVRLRLLQVELATGHLLEALGASGAGGRRARTRLALHGRRIRRGQPYVLDSSQLPAGSLLAHLIELGHAAHALSLAAEAAAADTLPRPPPRLPPGPLGWRLATRVTLAAGLAMAGGMALSPQRWFWAIITVYVVFLNARSRGHTVYRGLQRVGGTLLGMISGLVAAALLAGDPVAEIIALLASVFGMYYLIIPSYAAGIFCVTVMLGLLYGMMGASLQAILLLRLEETAIGAAAAIAVAVFVLPTRTRDQVIEAGRTVLGGLADCTRACREALAGGGASPGDAVRRLDRQVADLRLALAPLAARRRLFRRSALERPVPALLDCVRWARALAGLSATPLGPDRSPTLQRLQLLEARLARLAGRAPAPSPELKLPANSAPSDQAPADRALADTIEHMEAAVAVMTERLKLGAMEGFALDS